MNILFCGFFDRPVICPVKKLLSAFTLPLKKITLRGIWWRKEQQMGNGQRNDRPDSAVYRKRNTRHRSLLYSRCLKPNEIHQENDQ